MKDSRLHDELQTFPKSHKLNEKSFQTISQHLEKEVAMSQVETHKGFYSNKKIFACSLLTLAVSTILILSFVGPDKYMEKLAGVHSVKLPTIENKQNVTIQEERDSQAIFGVSESQNSWVYDPREPRNLIMEGTSIVHIQVLASREAEILPKYENFYTYDPFTPLDVEILETIYGKTISGQKTIYVNGGDIRISNLLDSWVGEEYEGFEKMGLTTLPKEEQETKFISYTSEYDYKMEPGKEYAVILTATETDDELFIVMCRGYGIFEVEKTDQGGEIYKNVITGRTFELNF